MIESKRGQGLSTNAIILIILGVAVLVVLILGFVMGWDKIFPFLQSDNNNVDVIVQQCEVACSTNSKYDFCSVERELEAEDGTNIKANCAILVGDKEYGISDCNSVQCEKKKCDDIKVIINEKEKQGVLGSSVCGSSKIDVTNLANDTTSTNIACCITK